MPAIEQDLAYLYGADWRTQIRVLPATQAYVRAARADRRLAAPLRRARLHALPRRPVRRARSSSGCCSATTASTSDGIAFYDFPEIHKLKPFKDVYRERLDALALDDEPRAAVVEEACYAFRLNAAVFGELGAVHVRDRVSCAERTPVMLPQDG